MPSEIIVKQGAAIVWTGTYLSTTSTLTKTDDLSLDGLGVGLARQGAKRDMEYLGTAKFPARWLVSAAIEFATPPANGETVDFYWAGSTSSVIADANPGGTSGADALYAPTLLSASLLQLQYMGSLVATADATTAVQYQTIGILSTILRYGMPIVVNNTSDAFVTDPIDMYVALIPLIDEAQ